MRLFWFTRADGICAEQGEYDFKIFKLPSWMDQGEWRAVVSNGLISERRHFGSSEDARRWCEWKAEKLAEGKR